jgi:hypothetical protein
MSHFSLIVATKEYPSQEVLHRELQPFHQFECTGVDDQYVVDIDITEDLRKSYESGTQKQFRDKDGKYHDPYADRFYREPTEDEAKRIGVGSGVSHGVSFSSQDWGDGRGYRPKVHFCPENMQEVDVKYPELVSFTKYVEDKEKTPVACGESPSLAKKHKYGYAMLDSDGNVVKVIDRTNPNYKWDYWRVGGRYCRKFIPKPGAEGKQADLTYEWSYANAHPPVGVDIIRKCDMDTAKMKAERTQERVKWIEEIAQKGGLTFASVGVGLAAYWKYHDVWETLPEPRPFGKEFSAWLAERSELAAIVWAACGFSVPETKNMTVADWCAAAPYLTVFAFLREGKWAAEGEMGWFATVSDQNADWPSQFQALVDDVPDDWYLTVVDCHV